MSDQGYATPAPDQAYTPSSFVVTQKLDAMMSAFMEQKQILIEARRENAQLSDGLSNLRTEVLNLKEQLQSTSSGTSMKVKKKIPLDLSVS